MMDSEINLHWLKKALSVQIICLLIDQGTIIPIQRALEQTHGEVHWFLLSILLKRTGKIIWMSV